MGDVAKWVLLSAAAVFIVGLVLAFPIGTYMVRFDIYSEGIATVVDIAGNGLIFGRALINNLFSPFGRTALSGLMIWLVGKWILTYSLKVMVWVYHFVFK